jgi:lysophospholipase L1-like esterase
VWYHVAGVRSSNFLQLYVNGQLEAQTNVNFAQDYGSLPLYFGTSGQSYNDGRFAGFLDEVTLYNRALSASEIVAVYRAADVGLCKAPVFVTQPIGGTGYWGGSFALSAAAAGAMPLGYQWAKASTLLANATNSSLFLNRLQLANAGNYAVTASNLYGMATSAAATLNLKVADVALGFSGGGGGPGTPGLTVNGVPGQIYGIQYSANLGASTTWLGLTNVTLSGPTLTWYDPQAATVPQRYYRVVPGPIPVGYATWEVLDIGALWSDDFNRASLGSNWVILGGANAVVTNNELSISQTNVNLSRQLYYQPWLLSSDEWTIRWSQQFGALNAGRGVGVGIKNFQAAGGDDRGYNGLLSGSGADLGQMEIQHFDGIQQGLVASGPAMSLAAGDVIDCSLTRSGWTITATASNRVNGQVSSTSLVLSDAANLIAPTISRACIYPIQGAVYLDDISFTINHRKPARYVVVGASLSEGYNASSYSNGFLQVAQRSLSQTICNDSSSFNTTTNAVSILPEILAHQPSTAILELGGNDLQFGYPATQWQSQYSNLVAQLQLAGIQVKHCLSPPRNVVDLTPLKNWISTNYPAKDVIDLWTPLLQGSHSLNPAYDSGDGVHPNDAGHLLLGTVISTSLP